MAMSTSRSTGRLAPGWIMAAERLRATRSCSGTTTFTAYEHLFGHATPERPRCSSIQSANASLMAIGVVRSERGPDARA